MHDLPRFSHPDLLVGSDTYDDAGVLRLTDELALVQTLDFFTPMVDDPYLFGQIAAANALSDVYAMGGRPVTAMNIAAFPTCKDKSVYIRILQGGADKIKEAGALLVGGHTVDDNEPKYGLSVTGLVHPERVITNAGGAEGDLLFLTKPLGTGILCTAIKAEELSERDAAPALQGMATLNKTAAEQMIACGVKGATDITGFGLLGHLHELCQASGLAADVWADFVPVWPDTERFALAEMIPGGAYRNLNHLKQQVRFHEKIPEHQRLIFCDPQTSGGLLIAVPKQQAGKLEGLLETAQVDYAIIGRLRAGAGIQVLPD